jgi:hypothetical protein
MAFIIAKDESSFTLESSPFSTKGVAGVDEDTAVSKSEV